MKNQYPILYRPLLLCRTNATWPIKTKYTFLNILHRIYGILCCLSFTTITILQFVALTLVGNDFDEFLTIGSLFFLTNVTTIKYLTLVFQTDKVSLIVEHCSKLDRQFQQSTNENVQKLFKAYNKLAFYMTLYQTSAILTSTFVVAAAPYVKDLIIGEQYFVLSNGTVTDRVKKELPIQIWLPFDFHKSPGYEIGYFFSGYGGTMLGGFFIASWNGLILSIFICIKGYLDILEYYLVNLGSDTSKLLNTNENNRKVKYDIVQSIKLHQDIIILIDKVNDYIGPIMIFHSLTYSVLLCLCGFKIIISENLAFSIWKSNWYKFDKDANQCLRFMMRRCQKPLCFKIGPFGTISVMTCVGILKGGYAYMALLNRLYSK
ncbi:odorant receptor 30a-like [Chrysoperla carnea]|uniref:odorant receptor 30a-like n=1 Tax=Chrysoperla carnea TaxID=189513 RepID=UPI001D064957|nr:odorant receptor 30a-like [Chrysoperla carnea]